MIIGLDRASARVTVSPDAGSLAAVSDLQKTQAQMESAYAERMEQQNAQDKKTGDMMGTICRGC